MEINLDPELQAVTDAAAALGSPHAADVPLDALRAGYVMGSQMQSLADVACNKVENFDIPGPVSAIPARLYVPMGAGEGASPGEASPGEASPGMIFCHGGGFMIGDLDSHDSLCRQLANHGNCRVVAIDYRLAPENKFPASVDDAIAASEWICNNAASLGIDPNRIAIGGDSAGGNLSAVVSNHFAETSGPKLAFQLLIYPATNRTVETNSLRDLKAGVTLDEKILDYFNDGYFGGVDMELSDPRLSPALASSHAKVAPAHIVTAEYDPLRDEGHAYCEILKAAGVEVSYHCYPGLMHNFVQQTAVVTSARLAVEEMAGIMKKALA
jgi:acetyl esterase